jgi:hypothetical protein
MAEQEIRLITAEQHLDRLVEAFANPYWPSPATLQYIVSLGDRSITNLEGASFTGKTTKASELDRHPQTYGLDEFLLVLSSFTRDPRKGETTFLRHVNMADPVARLALWANFSIGRPVQAMRNPTGLYFTERPAYRPGARHLVTLTTAGVRDVQRYDVPAFNNMPRAYLVATPDDWETAREMREQAEGKPMSLEEKLKRAREGLDSLDVLDEDDERIFFIHSTYQGVDGNDPTADEVAQVMLGTYPRRRSNEVGNKIGMSLRRHFQTILENPGEVAA